METQRRAAHRAVTWFVPLVVIMSAALLALVVIMGLLGADVPDDIGSWRWLTARIA